LNQHQAKGARKIFKIIRRKKMKRKNCFRNKHYPQKSASFFIPVLLMVCLFLLPNVVKADEGWGPGQDKWKFELGGYFPSIDTSMQINGVDSGDDINLEDSLGFSDDDTIWRLDGYWRFFKKHRLGFGYYGFNRDGSVTLTEDLEIGDEIFKAGSFVSSELNLGFYTIDYMYSFFQGEKWEISGGLGAYWVDLEFSALGVLETEGEPVEEFFESTDFNGPLPYIGLAFEYYITPKWLAIAKGGYFGLEVGDVDGSLASLGAKLEYQFTRTWGLGLGYSYFRIDVTIDDGSLRSDLEYKYHGVQAYGILRF
jgi:hypothetical protein